MQPEPTDLNLQLTGAQSWLSCPPLASRWKQLVELDSSEVVRLKLSPSEQDPFRGQATVSVTRGDNCEQKIRVSFYKGCVISSIILPYILYTRLHTRILFWVGKMWDNWSRANRRPSPSAPGRSWSFFRRDDFSPFVGNCGLQSRDDSREESAELVGHDVVAAEKKHFYMHASWWYTSLRWILPWLKMDPS